MRLEGYGVEVFKSHPQTSTRPDFIASLDEMRLDWLASAIEEMDRTFPREAVVLGHRSWATARALTYGLFIIGA